MGLNPRVGVVWLLVPDPQLLNALGTNWPCFLKVWVLLNIQGGKFRSGNYKSRPRFPFTQPVEYAVNVTQLAGWNTVRHHPHEGLLRPLMFSVRRFSFSPLHPYLTLVCLIASRRNTCLLLYFITLDLLPQPQSSWCWHTQLVPEDVALNHHPCRVALHAACVGGLLPEPNSV